jgi:hypothetical protein
LYGKSRAQSTRLHIRTNCSLYPNTRSKEILPFPVVDVNQLLQGDGTIADQGLIKQKISDLVE